MQNGPIINHAKYFLSGSVFNTYKVLSTVATFSPLCQNGDVLVLKAFSDKCSGIHWFKTNFLASIQVNSCHKNGCAKFDWSAPATQFHITPPSSLLLPVQPTIHKSGFHSAQNSECHTAQIFPIHKFTSSESWNWTQVWYVCEYNQEDLLSKIPGYLQPFSFFQAHRSGSLSSSFLEPF